ncbi:MAG: universal stress protein [Gemmatimonadota bacterium]
MIPGVRRVFHPTDFSQASSIAFSHALKIALVAQAELDILHVTSGGEAPWANFPGVRETLEQWGVLAPGSTREMVAQLGIVVRKVVAKRSDPVDAALDYLSGHPTDLVVLGTHQSGGRLSWLHRPVAAPLARGARLLTLFIPEGVEGFVSFVDGSVLLRKVLVPVDVAPDPAAAVEAACVVAWALQAPEVHFTVLHVGSETKAPRILPEAQPGWTWSFQTTPGDIVDTILRVANETQADLIAMATGGRSGFLDALRGSTAERVIRSARCPVLAVPVSRAP